MATPVKAPLKIAFCSPNDQQSLYLLEGHTLIHQGFEMIEVFLHLPHLPSAIIIYKIDLYFIYLFLL